MSDAGYIYVRNWATFQHYRNQTNPPWIKAYRRLLSDDAYLTLSLADRGLLLNLWLLSSLDGEGRVSADRRLLARRLNVRRVSLEPLIEAGYITIRPKKRLDRSYKRTRAEAEAEAEKRSTSAERARDTRDGNGGTAIQTMDQERTFALQALVKSIGTDADANTPTSINRMVIVHRLSIADIQLARERITTADTDNKAKYAMGVLKSIAREKEHA